MNQTGSIPFGELIMKSCWRSRKIVIRQMSFGAILVWGMKAGKKLMINYAPSEEIKKEPC
jgi:hypothetical protein